MEVGFKTDKGLRRSNNEDACFVMQRDGVYIVADGVGGNNSGEIASHTAVIELAKYVEENPITELKHEGEIRKYFEECVKKVNFSVLELSQKYDRNKGMATTLVVAFVRKSMLYIVNVGDSRAYIFRDGELSQITEDHTYVNTLLKAGVISESEAENHENKNMITRAIGADYKIDADFFSVDIKTGDKILICTDGLYGEVNKSDIIEELESDKPMYEVCNELVERANENGGHDNITIICLNVTEEDVNE